MYFFFFKQKTAYEMRISDWSPDVCSSDLETVAQRAARYCPLPVQLNGQDLPREDWLKGAETIVEQDGVRIGIYRNYLHRHFSPSINFHAVTVASLLPPVAEKERHWAATIDIIDAPELQLVLPARKDRKNVVWGKSGSVRVDLGGGR